MHKKEDMGNVELATVAFGQSFQITAIQLLTTASSIINGGNRITPHFGIEALNRDKVGKNYSGTTFPGGHVEPGETFKESVIREIYEETGLTIQNPRLTGIYHWMTGDIRNVGFLYKTSEYEGKLISSEEGKVYWISGEQFLKKPLAPGMEQVWQMMHDENAQECLQTLTEEGIVSKIQ